MTPDEFVELIRDLRCAQKQIFSSRDRELLDECQRLEREVDRALTRGPFRSED